MMTLEASERAASLSFFNKDLHESCRLHTTRVPSLYLYDSGTLENFASEANERTLFHFGNFIEFEDPLHEPESLVANILLV